MCLFCANCSWGCACRSGALDPRASLGSLLRAAGAGRARLHWRLGAEGGKEERGKHSTGACAVNTDEKAPTAGGVSALPAVRSGLPLSLPVLPPRRHRPRPWVFQTLLPAFVRPPPASGPWSGPARGAGLLGGRGGRPGEGLAADRPAQQVRSGQPRGRPGRSPWRP